MRARMTPRCGWLVRYGRKDIKPHCWCRSLLILRSHPWAIERVVWTPLFANQWRAEGFDWIPVGPSRLDPEEKHFPREPAFAVAQSLANLVKAFDVAWFLERHWAAPALRERRFRDRALPVVVLDQQPDPIPIPDSTAEINMSGGAEYAHRWADMVTAPSAESSRPGCRAVAGAGLRTGLLTAAAADFARGYGVYPILRDARLSTADTGFASTPDIERLYRYRGGQQVAQRGRTRDVRPLFGDLRRERVAVLAPD